MIPGLDFVAIDFELANPKHSSLLQQRAAQPGEERIAEVRLTATTRQVNDLGDRLSDRI